MPFMDINYIAHTNVNCNSCIIIISNLRRTGKGQSAYLKKTGVGANFD